MNLYDYQSLASRTAKELPFELDLIHAALGITSEAGELATTIKAHVIYEKPLDRANLIEEIGDCLWFLSRMASALDLTLSHCAAENIQKLQKRYPEKYSDADALERKDKR